MIRFSAPAKIHLLGEHSVVYGKPAIISTINLRLTLTLLPTRHPKLVSRSIEKGLNLIQSAIEKAIKNTYRVKTIPPYQIEIKSDFPVGSGLGASAAISATLTAALLKLLKIKAVKQEIYEIAMAGEKAIHGNPSGSDLTAIIYGGTIWFRKETENLKLFSPLTIKIPALFLIDSGKPIESTGVMVKNVAKMSLTAKKEIFDELELLAKKLVNNTKEIKQIIKGANASLVKLGVVSQSTQKLIGQIENLGGAAKITGAGGKKNGSGMVIVLGPQTKSRGPHGTVYHSNPEKLKGLKLIKIKLSQEGLKPEK